MSAKDYIQTQFLIHNDKPDSPVSIVINYYGYQMMRLPLDEAKAIADKLRETISQVDRIKGK